MFRVRLQLRQRVPNTWAKAGDITLVDLPGKAQGGEGCPIIFSVLPVNEHLEQLGLPRHDQDSLMDLD